jgi:hypothetical protein
MVLCLLTCTLQGFVAQTHFHPRHLDGLVSAGYQAALDSEEDSPKHSRRDTSSTCPLCQIALHGGAAPAPAYTLSLPVRTAISIAPAEVAPPGASVAVSFNWQGRAPPLS